MGGAGFFLPWCSSPSGPRRPHYRGFITIGNKISLFFLAHEGKYQTLIDLLTLNSNTQVAFFSITHRFLVTAKLSVKEMCIYIIHTLFTLPKM